jgi:CheY-like chemotaxis protein
VRDVDVAGYRERREAALEAGCVAYLRKPFPSSALIEAIDQAV